MRFLQIKRLGLINTPAELIGLYLAGMLITVWLGILSTRANVSFARMRRKYIEDNEEQDKKLIAKVEGFYHHSYMVLAVTELGDVVAAFVFACLTWEDRKSVV